MRSPLDVALSYLDALGHDDPDAVATHVADDFHNEHQSAIGSGCTGRDAYRGRLPGFMASFPNREYAVIETIGPTATDDNESPDDERTVAVRYRLRADVDGHRIDIPGVMWFGVRNGLITRRIDTWDSLTFFRQTEQEPPPAG
jgi:ketosteroid isomerase-like protein